MRRVALLAVTCALALAGGAGGAPAVSTLWLGGSGSLPRLFDQTGQRSSINSFFIGWEQGQTWGSRFTVLLDRFGPIPMFHVGTLGRSKREAITPLGIAQGRGDAYLIHLSQGIAEHEGLVYARLMAEMNHHGNAYSAFTEGGASRGPQYAPTAHRLAFRRFHVILHGGSAAAINAQLRAAGVAPYRGPDLTPNPRSRLRTIWNPLGGGVPAIPANAATQFFPGRRWVDVVGNDIYAASPSFSIAANEALYRFARSQRLPYALPEWGINRADVFQLVDYVCAFIKRSAAVELAAYYEAKPGSPYDLGSKPQSRARYRACLRPLAAPVR